MVEDSEAMTLKQGDLISVLHRDEKRYLYRVVRVNPTFDAGWRVTCRRVGNHFDGKRYGPRRLHPEVLELLERNTSVTKVVPHVYADFLEEHGEQRAADLLREAFPME
jgi:hypothetical protein